MSNDNSFISKDSYLNIYDKVIFHNNIDSENNVLSKEYISDDTRVFIDLDLNTKNQNCIGLFSCYGSIYCEKDFYISDNKSDKYVFVNNEGMIECNNIKMHDKVLIGDLKKTENQVKNSIVINASDSLINANKEGFYITPIRQELSKKILFYNSETSEITCYDSNIFIGPRGDIGFQGPRGDIGPQGSIGEKGPQGNIGEKGPQGSIGEKGPQGNIGEKGSQGSIGEKGSQGSIGEKGPQGNIGHQGSIGEKGPQGSIGHQGSIGEKGHQGSIGEKGHQGSIGEKGPQGSIGHQGSIGLQGIVGTTGPQGIVGTTGPQGIAGDRFSTKSLNLIDISPYTTLLQFQVEKGLSYIPGNSVIVVNSDISVNDPLNSFEGIIYGYNKESGNIIINNIVNIHGVFTGSHYYLVNLDGVDGPQGDVGQIGPEGPVSKKGNIGTIDSIYGDDNIASVGGSSFRTIEAAINAISTNQTIYILPGYYNLREGIIIPDGIIISGMNAQNCIIQMLNVTVDTTLIKMKNNCILENVTLILTSNEHYTLKGIVFEGISGKLYNSVLNINNSPSSSNGISTVIGVECNEIGTIDLLKNSSINIYSNGNGNKRGVLLSNSSVIKTIDLNIYIAQPISTDSMGSYVGVETADPSNSGSIHLRTTIIETVSPNIGQDYTASDILQTNPVNNINNSYLISPGIHIGPGTELIKKTAGGKGFSTYSYSTILFYGLKGIITSTGYLMPFIQQTSSDISNIPTYFIIQQTSILCGLSLSLNTAPSSTNTTTLLVQYTPISTGIISDTIFTITLTGIELQSSFYNSSLTLNKGDKIHLYLSYSSDNGTNFSSDINAQINLF